MLSKRRQHTWMPHISIANSTVYQCYFNNAKAMTQNHTINTTEYGEKEMYLFIL